MPIIDSEHIIFVGLQGKFGEAPDYSTKQDIDALTQRIRDSGKKTISLHFHGGLVGRNPGVDGARFFATSLTDTDTYPICFVWETDLLTVLRERLLTINESKLFRKILLKALKKFAERYVPALESRGSKSKISEDWLTEEMSRERPFSKWNEKTGVGSRSMVQDKEYERGESKVTKEIQSELEYEFDSDPEMDALIKEYNIVAKDPNNSRSLISAATTILKIAKIVWRVIKRFHNERDHGFYPTVVEEVLREFHIGEIGSEVWGLMKTKAEDMWDIDGPNHNVASYFLESMMKHLEDQNQMRINLVGHSAGSIAVFHGYNALRNRNATHLLKEVIFIAPACRFDLAGKMFEDPTGLKGRWSIFALSDEREKSDIMLPVVYPQSLLYFVSGLLELDEDKESGYDEHILGMERFWKEDSIFANDEGIGKVKEIFSGQPNGIAFAPILTGTLGRMANGWKHGEIDNDPVTVENIKYLITN